MNVHQICEELRKRGIPETQGFKSFKIDLRRAKTNKGMGKKGMFSKDEIKQFLQPLIEDLDGTIIFNIDNKYDNVENNKNFIMPFNKMFINSQVLFPLDGEVYITNGYFLRDIDEDCFGMSFVWSRIIKDGWKPITLIIRKKAIERGSVNIDEDDFFKGLPREASDYFMNEFVKLFNYLIYKVEKKEYTSYKKWTRQGYSEGEIVYDKDVRQHKRHFWEDSGKFNIPKWGKEKWELQGYKTHEVVFKNGELRRDVPYIIIGEKIQKAKKNKVYNLFTKTNLKQEQKIYNILLEIFPDKLIRRHDRKTLKGIELDFNIPELRLGIEYDGEQHFDKELYEKLYGDGFEEQVKRDRLKDKLCKKKNITLIRIKYDEPLTKSHIKKRLR